MSECCCKVPIVRCRAVGDSGVAESQPDWDVGLAGSHHMSDVLSPGSRRPT